MSIALLDVNTLIALLWRPHRHHPPALEWFKVNEKKGWATCAITQLAFVRIVSNRTFANESPSPAEATALLRRNIESPYHHFLIDDLSFPEAVASIGQSVSGHQQTTDAYLLALAIHHQGHLVTFDRGITILLPEPRRKSGLIVTLSDHSS
ncbi:hypothetical protein HNQ77_001849 [Silvibacterium bohemicum]|uniref:Ribonuclease VapC n=1 Tax=Silvibacterium bohemicum TaxID=1577686 RepID=A0A841JRW5_9BACT|nr:TA system VapC family ribonuclease toxin [Silvibacterium bohemicum]MBB6143900.1 hypothetical protein [Silvibacterium bohemicum]